ncbi:MAG: carboxypeptidase regulatory-like domain-containing protein [Planctomycetes bacterium]|nr:carboxypeptidase regulatory-like domain-containing protein [Planctomycetota bacterium]
MNRRGRICLVLLLWGLGLPAGAGEAPAADSPEALVKLLEEGDFDERQDAEAKLKEIGEDAYPALKKALESPNLEVREIAKRLMSLEGEAVLRILLIDAQGKPAEGETLTYFLRSAAQQSIHMGFSSEDQKTAPTDAHGSIVLEGLKNGAYMLNMQWPQTQAQPEGGYFQRMYLASGVNRIRFRLPAMIKIQGLVTTGKEAKPLAGASVELLPDSGLPIPKSPALLERFLEANMFGRQQNQVQATTGEDGRFTLEKVTAGRYRLLARHEDHVLAISEPVDVSAEQDIALDKPLVLFTKAETLGGFKVIVQDEEGKPAAQAKVKVTLVPLSDEGNDDGGLEGMGAFGIQLGRMGRMQEWLAPKDLETDADGRVELKELHPGKYRLAIEGGGGAERVWESFTVESGAIVELEPRKAPEPGTLRGTIVDGAGKGVQHAQCWAVECSTSFVRDALEAAARQHPWQLRSMAPRSETPITSKADGSYEIGQLSPGRYVLIFALPDNAMGIIRNLEVAAGKTVDAPKLNTGAKAKDEHGVKRVKGTVLLPDGQPASQAQLTMFMGPNSTWGSNVGAQGTFDFNLSHGGNRYSRPTLLMARVPGYLPAKVDLTAEGVDLTNIKVNLQPQQFGRLKVKAVDAEGKPLAGVWVTPQRAPNSHWNGRQQAPQSRTTNALGEVSFRGLAVAKRRFSVAKNGYFHEGSLEVELKADEEVEATATLKPGFAIEASLRAPEGFKVEDAIVYLTPDQLGFGEMRSASPDEAGEIRFTGLPPGRYQLNPCLPGCVPALTRYPVEIKAASEKLEIAFVPPPRIALDLGPAWAGAMVQAGTPRDAEEKEANGFLFQRQAMLPALDAQGRTRSRPQELSPGRYDLTVFSGEAMGRFSGMPRPRKQGQFAIVRRIVQGIDVAPGATGEEYLKIALEPGKGKLKGWIDDAGVGDKLAHTGQVIVILEGPGAKGELYLALNAAYGGNWRLIEPETDAAEKPDEANLRTRFDFDALPPGAYTLKVKTYMHRYDPETGVSTPLQSLLRINGKDTVEFEVAEGAEVDLGKLSLELTEQALADIETMNAMRYPSEFGDDEVPVFKP